MKAIEQATKCGWTTNQYIKLLKQNGWTYRIYNDIPTNQIGQRISLNVKGDSKLIRELDILMTQGQYRDKSGRIFSINPTDFYYKTYHFPAFNVADSCITVGVALIIIDILFFSKKRDNDKKSV